MLFAHSRTWFPPVEACLLFSILFVAAGMPARAHEGSEAAAVPCLYVIGDSTAAENPPDRYPRMGWAQVLRDYVDASRLCVLDKAKGGRSAKSFYEEGSWKPLYDALKAGDYVFIQFGHNDSKKSDPNRFTDPATSYRQYLKRYIEETRSKGACPILLTSIQRNAWEPDKSLKDTHGGYPPAMRALSKELNVPLIDLHARTDRLFQRLGSEKTASLFMNLGKGISPNFPDGSVDNTHLQETGARAICRLVVDAIEDQELPLRACLQTLPAKAAAPASSWSTTGPRTIFAIRDADQCAPVTSGRWRLSGVLEVHFTGRIEPHENSVCSVFGEGVEALDGRFDQVLLPDGWQCDVVYGRKKPGLILRNFRPERAPAFPSAEGFGKYTIGGRGGRVIEVTNLNDKGPGSLREACEARGPRTIVFRVSGTIALESELKVRNPYLTIAGQTAPGDGICIKNYQFNFDTQHLIVRHMRFRPGDEKQKEQDAFGGGGDHILVDHCSVSWGIDETLSINKASNVTVQWCLVSESLTKSLHKKGAHGYGGLWGGPGGSFHHNILAHHSSRNPRASGNPDSGLLDLRNNVIYNWGFNSAYGGELWPRNWINNYYKYGPATSEEVLDRIFLQKDPRGKMYCAGNFVWGFPAVSKDNWRGGVDFAPDGEATEQTLRVNTPYVVAPVKTQSAKRAFKRVLRQAGASLHRDAVDSRVLREIRTGTAQYGETYGGGGKGLINSQSAVGGWPELRSLPAPEDSDHDGMPDAWERKHGLDPGKPEDGAQDADGDGYTNLEEYLNSIAP